MHLSMVGPRVGVGGLILSGFQWPPSGPILKQIPTGSQAWHVTLANVPLQVCISPNEEGIFSIFYWTVQFWLAISLTFCIAESTPLLFGKPFIGASKAKSGWPIFNIYYCEHRWLGSENINMYRSSTRSRKFLSLHRSWPSAHVFHLFSNSAQLYLI